VPLVAEHPPFLSAVASSQLLAEEAALRCLGLAVRLENRTRRPKTELDMDSEAKAQAFFRSEEQDILAQRHTAASLEQAAQGVEAETVLLTMLASVLLLK
jgi:hypothetical protein